MTMKAICTLIVLTLTTSLTCAGQDVRTAVGKFIRETGHFMLDKSGSTLSITKESTAKWSLDLVWQEGRNLRLEDSPNILHSAGWFVYVETPDRLWVYDGDKHLIFEGHERQKIIGGMSPKIWATCPKEVLEALPEKAGGKKKPNTALEPTPTAP